MYANSRLKATKIKGQRKALYRQRIPESSCARKKTVDIDILVTSRNGDRKIMQSIRTTSRPPSRKRKWKQLSQFWRTSTKLPFSFLIGIYSMQGWTATTRYQVTRKKSTKKRLQDKENLFRKNLQLKDVC